MLEMGSHKCCSDKSIPKINGEVKSQWEGRSTWTNCSQLAREILFAPSARARSSLEDKHGELARAHIQEATTEKWVETIRRSAEPRTASICSINSDHFSNSNSSKNCNRNTLSVLYLPLVGSNGTVALVLIEASNAISHVVIATKCQPCWTIAAGAWRLLPSHSDISLFTMSQTVEV